MKVITLRIDDFTDKELEAVSKASKNNKSNFIRMAIIEKLNRISHFMESKDDKNKTVEFKDTSSIWKIIQNRIWKR